MSLKVRSYTIKSEKIRSPHSLVFLTDLHGTEHGPHNAALIDLCRRCRPDMILCGGDMLTARMTHSVSIALDVLKKLTAIAPVYAGFGNHESHAVEGGCLVTPMMPKYLKKAEDCGVKWLVRDSVDVAEDLTIAGFEAEYKAYKKFSFPKLTEDDIKNGTSLEISDDRYSILMAHNPRFTEDYFRIGADLTLCGHFHGGVMKLTDHQVLISPYGIPFPKYGHGLYTKDDKNVIVSAGIGDHVIPMRINNPMEVVHITLLPLQS